MSMKTGRVTAGSDGDHSGYRVISGPAWGRLCTQ